MTKKLYKFEKYFHRQGTLEGLFIAKEDDVSKLVNDKIDVYFGEVLGKHSSIGGIIINEDIIQMNVYDSTVNELLLEFGHTLSGYNPFDYLEDKEE